MTPAEQALGTPVAAPSLGGVLRRPAFLLLVLGQTISQLGDKLHHMALIALVGAGARAETGGLELAKLSVVFTAPAVLVGPLAGALVDRWDKRRTMLACDFLRALLVGAIPWLYLRTGHLWIVYVVAFFVFVLGLFFNSAKMALIPDLVGPREFLPANAALTSIGRVATVVGIVGGGFIIAAPLWSRLGWQPHDAGFYLDAASFGLSVLTLLGIMGASRLAGPPRAAPAPAARPTLRDLAYDVRAATRVIRQTPGLRTAFASMVLLALFASTVYVAMTVSVQTVMGRGTAGVGILGGVLAGGMVVGSLVVGSVGDRWSRELLLARGIVAIGVLMLLASASFTWRTFLPVAFLGGALLAPVMVAQDTLLHEHAPAASRATLFSTRDLLLAALFAGTAFVVGGSVLLMSHLGVREPYRYVLGLVGACLLVTAPALARPRPLPSPPSDDTVR